MRRVALALAVAFAVPGVAHAAELTPDGPATLMNRWEGAVPAIALPPSVLLGARVAVGEGGRAGTIRVRARSGASAGVGQAVELPAAPGTYTVPAPRIRWQYSTSLGIDQTTGGHAVVERRRPCTPELGPYADWCQVQLLDIFAGDPPPGPGGTPTDTRGGAELTMTPVSEYDVDEDLLGDATEDRTDLKLIGTARRGEDGRVRATVTVANAGPLKADLPRVAARGLPGKWRNVCPPARSWIGPREHGCSIDPLTVGARSRALTWVSEPGAAGRLVLAAEAEGPDLADADNTATLEIAAPPELTLAFARPPTLRRGIKVWVSAARDGRARVSVGFAGTRVRLGRTIKLRAFTPRAVTLRPRGFKLRALRAAAPPRAEITVRRAGGKTAVRFKARVR